MSLRLGVGHKLDFFFFENLKFIFNYNKNIKKLERDQNFHQDGVSFQCTDSLFPCAARISVVQWCKC